ATLSVLASLTLPDALPISLTVALIFALLFAPVLASYRGTVRSGHEADTRLVHWLKHHYERLLIRLMWNRRFVVPIAVAFLLVSRLEEHTSVLQYRWHVVCR